MINALKVYFKIALACRTPFVFLMDSRYWMCPMSTIKELLAKMGLKLYVPEKGDCDDFAWHLKGIASGEMVNSIGIVIGFVFSKGLRGMHAWNIALCQENVLQIEPQNGYIFVKDRRYRPIVIII